ncbi:MAG: HD domain-containing phosphohydrolase [Polyangiales bacterium]
MGGPAMIESSPPEAVPSGSILLVDDDAGTLRALSRFIVGLGYKVVGCTVPAEALALLALRSFEAIVVDLRLPMADGKVFAWHARASAPQVPMIVVTGSSDAREVCGLLRGVTADAIIVKDPHLDALADALDRCVGEGRELARMAMTGRLIADGLVRALACRDTETEGHSRRVAAWTLMLAKSMGAPRADWWSVEVGGLLHDIGKIGVPDAILRKPGKLTESEFAEIRRHPAIGCEILAGIPALAAACNIVRSHHESWDGTGYPDRLAGEATPLYARVFALVDTYDAITADRHYRKGRSTEVAREIIRTQAGKQFDPSVVEAFFDIPTEAWLEVAHIFSDHAAAPVGGRSMIAETSEPR